MSIPVVVPGSARFFSDDMIKWNSYDEDEWKHITERSKL